MRSLLFPGRQALSRVLVLIGGFILLSLHLRSPADNPSSDSLRVWAHAGQESERRILTAQVERYLSLHPDERVELLFVPEGGYHSQVQAAALAGSLPHLLELDAPYVPGFVWQRQLTPLRVSAELRANLLPSLLQQGSYAGRLYAVGAYDSGLGLYGRRSRLDAVGARIPLSPGEAWSIEEFSILLRRLAARDADGAVLDLKLNDTGEWFCYAFAPAFESAGVSLAGGKLGSPAACRTALQLQRWMQTGLVDPNLDDAAFVSGRVPLSWVGHWEYTRYARACQDDLVLLPLPDFGQGSRTGQGSWMWTATGHHPAALRLLEYLLQDAQVLELSAANGAVPGTRSAVRRSALYGDKGPLQLFAWQLEHGIAVPRPQTPGYSVFSSLFQRALQDVLHGALPSLALTRAQQQWELDLKDNQSYRMNESYP